MRFTIIIPTRDRPVQLRACLAGVRDLDYDPGEFETIVVTDGGAALPTADARVLRQHPARGPAAARNLGARHANSTWLAFIDDDCIPQRQWLRELETQLDGNVMTGGMVRNAVETDQFAATTQAIIDYFYSKQPVFFTSNNLAVNAARFHSIGGFDGTWPLAASEDRDFCLRWTASGGRLIHAPKAIVQHSHNPSLEGFLKQHFRYGRGACWLRRKHESVPHEVSGAVRYAASRSNPALVLLAQLATVAGFLRETLWSGQITPQLTDGPPHSQQGDQRTGTPETAP